MSVENKIFDLITTLNRIAKKNKDEFAYRIVINQNRTGLEYIFECSENCDGHPFVTGISDSIEQALDNALLEIDSCCKEWGYKQ